MATQSKAQYLADVQALLKRRYKPSSTAPKLSVFESVIYGICHEDATRIQAEAAMQAFRTGFFDWNEVRVSPISEIQGVFERLRIPDAEERANRLRRFLRQLFEKAYAFNLDPLLKKPLKDATKALQDFEAAGDDFVIATVTRVGLGGHAIGIDRPTRRALERLGAADRGQDDASLRGTLERAVAKNRGTEFVDLIEDLAHDTCVEGEPDCPRCELRKICPSSRTRRPEPSAKAGAKPVSAATTSGAGKGAQSPPSAKAKGKPVASTKAAPGPAPATKAAAPAQAKSAPAKVAAKPAAPASKPTAPAKAVAPAKGKATVKVPPKATAPAKISAKPARPAPAPPPAKTAKGKPGRAK